MKAKVSIRVEFKQAQSLKWWFYVTTISSMGVVKVKRFSNYDSVQKYIMSLICTSTKFLTKYHKYIAITLEKEYANTSIIC